jgi:hypothetical protein
MKPSDLKFALSLAFFDSPASQDIYLRLLPEWAERFALGQEKYQDVEHLGPKGVFPDVNRKVGRLRSDIWEGRTPPEGAEPTREVILDLIGHLFLMLHLEDQAPLAGLDPHHNEPAGTGYLDRDDPPEDPEEEDEPQSAAMTPLAAPAPPMTNWMAGDDGILRQIRPSWPAVMPEIELHYSSPSDGWNELPEGARAALRCIAHDERVSRWAQREVKTLVEKTD